LAWWWQCMVETCSHSVTYCIHYITILMCCVLTVCNILYNCYCTTGWLPVKKKTTWADNTETSVLGLRYEGVEWIHLARARDSFHLRVRITPGHTWSAYPSSASQELFSVTLDFEISFSVPKIQAVCSCEETSPVQQTTWHNILQPCWKCNCAIVMSDQNSRPWNGRIRSRQAWVFSRYDHRIIHLCLQTARFICFVNHRYEIPHCAGLRHIR